MYFLKHGKDDKELHYKVLDRGHYSEDYAQLCEDESVLLALLLLVLLKCMLISLCALLPDFAKLYI